MNVSARSHRFDATLETTIVTAVRGVLDLQIVDATVGSEIQSAIKYNEENYNNCNTTKKICISIRNA